MIQGLFLDIFAKEMREHALKRAQYHENRAKGYEEEIEKLKKLRRETDEESGALPKNAARDPIRDLEDTARGHRRKEVFFRFAYEHFVIGETYRLGLSDLQEFEISPRG